MLYKNLITLVLIGALSACSDDTVNDIPDDDGIVITDPVDDGGDPDTGTDPDPDTGTDPDPETGTDPDPETGTDPDPETGTDPDPDTGTDPDPDTGTDPDPETGTDPDPETGTDPDPETGTDPDPETGTDPDPETGTDPDGCSTPYEISLATDNGTHNSSQGPENAIDGDYDSASRWASEGIGKEITFDLGDTKDLAALQIMWLSSNERNAYYDIETSSDEVTWTNVFLETQTSITTAEDTFEVVNFDQTVNAQYIKIIGQGNSKDGNNWNSIIEAQAFSCSLEEPIVVPETPEEPEEPAEPIDYEIIYDAEDALPCDNSGQMLYDGVCADYTAVYEEEHGELNEGAYLVSSSPIEMTFDALAAQEVTPNGNGWRHELKIKSSGDYRVGMTELYELFKAKITVELDDGAKTIVAQHHADTTDTITKLYIADLDEGGFETAPDGITTANSIAMDGIFDVYIRLANEDDDNETKYLLTTIKSGESFYFEEENNHGTITVKINGDAVPTRTIKDSSASYFKFGNYQQAQYPEDIDALGIKVGDKLTKGNGDGDWPAFYAEYFDTSKITFTEMSYIRTLD